MRSPTVVGMLNITTDVWTDIMTLGITRMWLNQNAEPMTDAAGFLAAWNQVHTVKHATYENAAKLLMGQRPRRELLDVIQTVRCMSQLPLRLRMSLVARGIPVCAEESATN